MANSNYLTNAINIKSYSLSEADKIVVMYSKEKGLMRGVAKGTKKPKSKLGGRMDMLVANKLMLYKGKNLDTICQAEALDTFNNLRVDMDKMLYAMYMSEVVSNFGAENDPNSEEIYDIFYSALSQTAKTSGIVGILLTAMRFQLKMMRACGYELQLTHCINCGCSLDNKEIIFSPEKGGIRCISCAREFGGGGMHFQPKLREFLAYLSDSDFDAICEFDEKATETICKSCFGLIKSYVELHSPRQFKTDKMLV